MNPINDRADNAGDENNLPPRPPDEAVVPPRQPRRGLSFWPIELNCDRFSDGALARATRLIEAALRQNTDDEADEWSGKDSDDYGYPDAHHQRANRGNAGQLWPEHCTFLAALPDYLQYGGGSRTYHCPCSRGMAEWRRRIDLELPPLVICRKQFATLPALMQHCHSNNDIYHRGFREYVRAMTEM